MRHYKHEHIQYSKSSRYFRIAAFSLEVNVCPWITQPGFQRPWCRTSHNLIYLSCKCTGMTPELQTISLCPSAGRTYLQSTLNPRVDLTHNALPRFGDLLRIKTGRVHESRACCVARRVCCSLTSPVFNKSCITGCGLSGCCILHTGLAVC